MSKQRKEIDNILDDLFIKYEGNSYMENKIHNYIVNHLPGTLEANDTNHKQREERKNKLNSQKDKFTSSFLGKNNYFYCNLTEYFFIYNGHHYSIYNEDDIVHEILRTISHDQSLMSWKHKIKKNIICKIKEKTILKSIPESQTIQHIISHLYPAIFPSKNIAKYFLVLIGDNLLKKNDNSIYFISQKIKPLLKEISDKAYIYLGHANIVGNIKYKYYDHDYKDCRLIKINDFGSSNLTLAPDFSKNILDLLCVATHYSERYKSADQFLKNNCEEDVIEHVLYLQNNDSKNIVDKFIDSSLQTSDYVSIDMKNMFFLWKRYLESINIPNVIFNNPLKAILKDKLKYNEEKDCFTDITSVHLPVVSDFIQFWEGNIIYKHLAEDAEDEYEFEISEICALFKHSTNKIGQSVSEKNILDLIQHFYPDVTIEDNKYILHIHCKLWNKDGDIIDILEKYKTYWLSKPKITTSSIYDIYTYYCKYSINKTCIVSKTYFERFVSQHLNEYINDKYMISNDWLNSS